MGMFAAGIKSSTSAIKCVVVGVDVWDHPDQSSTKVYHQSCFCIKCIYVFLNSETIWNHESAASCDWTGGWMCIRGSVCLNQTGIYMFDQFWRRMWLNPFWTATQKVFRHGRLLAASHCFSDLSTRALSFVCLFFFFFLSQQWIVWMRITVHTSGQSLLKAFVVFHSVVHAKSHASSCVKDEKWELKREIQTQKMARWLLVSKSYKKWLVGSNFWPRNGAGGRLKDNQALSLQG